MSLSPRPRRGPAHHRSRSDRIERLSVKSPSLTQSSLGSPRPGQAHLLSLHLRQLRHWIDHLWLHAFFRLTCHRIWSWSMHLTLRSGVIEQDAKCQNDEQECYLAKIKLRHLVVIDRSVPESAILAHELWFIDDVGVAVGQLLGSLKVDKLTRCSAQRKLEHRYHISPFSAASATSPGFG